MIEQGIINVSVSSHYSCASSVADIATQGILGEKVEILERGVTHALIRQEDGYTSWIPLEQFVYREEEYSQGLEKQVRSHFMRIYSAPSTDSAAVRDAVIGSRLQVTDERDGWYRLLLPDGTVGWAASENFGVFPPFSSAQVVALAREFLGYQYLWGGCTVKGFDCSGFVQRVFSLLGVQLPRDAWQQQKQGLRGTEPLAAAAGDLLFFSAGEKVTHVAIALGRGEYIHAGGWVRINSFHAGDPHFVAHRLQSFTSVNRYGAKERI